MSLTQEQLEKRKNRVMASEISALLGFNPYCDPPRAWTRATGAGGYDVDEDMSVAAGTHLEQALLEWSAKDLGIGPHGWETDHGTILLGEMFGATPDGISTFENLGIQIKNHNPAVARTYKGLPGRVGKWDNNLVPLHINMQCQWEMYVCNETGTLKECDTWLLCSYFGGGNRRIYWLKRDQQLQDSLAVMGAIYWHEHLNPKGPRTPPTEIPWTARGQGIARKTRRLPTEALQHAPIPFAEPLVPQMPFGEKQ